MIVEKANLRCRFCFCFVLKDHLKKTLHSPSSYLGTARQRTHNRCSPRWWIASPHSHVHLAPRSIHNTPPRPSMPTLAPHPSLHPLHPPRPSMPMLAPPLAPSTVPPLGHLCPRSHHPSLHPPRPPGHLCPRSHHPPRPPGCLCPCPLDRKSVV